MSKRGGFRRTGARGFDYDLAEPLPESLAEIEALAKRVKAHRALASKSAQLRERTANLRRRHQEAERGDREAAEQASLAGEKIPRRKAPALARQIENVERELEATETLVPKSADALLEAARAHVEEAVDVATAGEEQALERAADLLAALDRELGRHAQLASERIWLKTLPPVNVEPFRPHATGPVQILRRVLADSFREYIGNREEAQREAARWEAFEREQEQERQRHAAEVEREQQAARVVTEGMAVVSRGGEEIERDRYGREATD
jgi:hypothetical protein